MENCKITSVKKVDLSSLKKEMTIEEKEKCLEKMKNDFLEMFENFKSCYKSRQPKI
ncbi:hypothetical protein CLV51_1011729 [Chitinophaga niastensis]|uniref:Uncharacterized protein n=1 Tax=Chitinophaga niastensis TaxID=536980 RepID=A0A2P8HW45_CHINA|nr:hypothetical protein CLV51_1011729 [Chitinophaga niastensis]